MLHLKALPPTHSKISIILQTTLISVYNFKRLFLQIENYNTSILKPHQLNYLGTERHPSVIRPPKNIFCKNKAGF